MYIHFVGKNVFTDVITVVCGHDVVNSTEVHSRFSSPERKRNRTET